MIEIELDVPAEANLEALCAAIDVAGMVADLYVSLSGTLRRFPGSRHWHLKQGLGAGTVEVTVWPRARRIWISLHKGRDAAWIAGALPRVQDALAALLR